MKRILSVLFMLCLFAAPALAADGKTEVGINGQFVQVEEGDDLWTMNFDLLLPVGQGHIVIGPTVGVGSVDELNRMGGAFEWNFFGQGPVTFFAGARAVYFQKDTEGLDRHAASWNGGVKIALGPGAAIKVSTERVVDGRGKDETDQSFSAGVIARF